MSRRRRAAEDGFEDLLDGRDPGSSALGRVLDAARAPGRPDELSGLGQAQAAFLMARQPHRTRAARGSRLPATTRSAAGRLFVLKAAAAVSGVTLVGGVAYAATGAHLLGGGSDQHRVHFPAATTHASRPGYPARPGGGTTRYGTSEDGSRGATGPTSRPSGQSSSARSVPAPTRTRTHVPTQTHSPNPPGPRNSDPPSATHAPNPHASETPRAGITPTHTRSPASGHALISKSTVTPSDHA